MTQPSAAEAKLVDKSNNPQLADRQAAVNTDIVQLTDSTGGTANGSTLDLSTLNITEIKDDFATVAAKINEIVVQQNLIIDALEAHGLIADN